MMDRCRDRGRRVGKSARSTRDGGPRVIVDEADGDRKNGGNGSG